MAKQVLVSEAIDRFRQKTAALRAGVMRGLPAALGDCNEGCAQLVTAELEKRLDEVIASAEAGFIESLNVE